MPTLRTLESLPKTGFLRVPDLVGVRPVTPEQAEANRRSGHGPKRPRPEQHGLLPFSAPTLWRLVKARKFVSPVKLSERVTAFRVEDVRAWMQSRAA